MEFRSLTAEEVICEVEGIGQNFVKLLLYHDPSVDRAILNETVGPFGWQAFHYKQDGQLCCRVGIDKFYASDRRNPCFIWKSGAGRKRFDNDQGESSSAFQKACMMWNLGDELYTAPKIIVSANVSRKNGYLVTDDLFRVKHLKVEWISCPEPKKFITELIIERLWKDKESGAWQRKTAFDWKRPDADGEDS